MLGCHAFPLQFHCPLDQHSLELLLDSGVRAIAIIACCVLSFALDAPWLAGLACHGAHSTHSLVVAVLGVRVRSKSQGQKLPALLFLGPCAAVRR